MSGIQQFAHKIWSPKKDKTKGEGLFVTADDLMEQRHFVRYLHVNYPPQAHSFQSGDIKSVFKGRGMEFEEIRPYAYGDDVRDIDWRVTARKSAPYTKIFAEERDREVYVCADLSPRMMFGSKNELKSVTVAKITALLGWLSLENKDRFGSVIYDGSQSFLFKPQNHRGGLLALLNQLAQASKANFEKVSRNYKMMNEPFSLEKSLNILQGTIKSRAIVFVISHFDGMSESEKKSLALLAKKTNLICINVYDVLEAYPPASGEYMAEFGKEKLIFNSLSPKFRRQYRMYFAEKRQEIEDFCRKFSCRYLEVRNDMPLYQQLKNV